MRRCSAVPIALGAGKTTLAKIVAGFHAPTASEVPVEHPPSGARDSRFGPC